MTAPGFVLFGDLPKIAPFVIELHQRGLHVLVITGTPESSLERAAHGFLRAPGHPLGLIHDLALISAHDQTAVLRRIRSWTETHTIRGAFSTAETYVEIASVVTDLLDLPGIGLRAGRVARNKHLQRLYLTRWSPRHTIASASRAHQAHELLDRCPTIIKPLTLYSSIGIRRITDHDDLNAALAAAPDQDFLIEERITGPEFSVESIVQSGKVVFAAVTEKLTNEGESPYFVELGHTTPPLGLAEPGGLLDANASILERLAFGTGMAHTEFRLAPDGRAVLMEIAARPPGDGIMALHHLATGRSLEGSIITALLGGEVDHPSPTRWSRQIYLDHTPGTLMDVTATSTGTEPRWLTRTGVWPLPRPVHPHEPARLHDILILKEQGETLYRIAESSHRAVTAIFDAPAPADLRRLDDELRAAITVRTE
ncbi:hypothetical protein GCM10022221_49450 [Actinocorallia aurea]